MSAIYIFFILMVSHLMELKELNLSENHIQKIEGMETLVNLQRINLNGNKIKEIPKSI